jgi:hypothetical protein
MIARATLLAAGHREVAEDEAVPPGRGEFVDVICGDLQADGCTCEPQPRAGLPLSM